MQHRLPSILILLAGIINFLPVIGIFSASQLSAMYGIEVTSPALEILLRHRAALFGIIGGFMIVSAFVRNLQGPAIIIGFISMISFLLLAWSVGDGGTALQPIVYADVAGCVFLVSAVILRKRIA